MEDYGNFSEALRKRLAELQREEPELDADVLWCGVVGIQVRMDVWPSAEVQAF